MDITGYSWYQEHIGSTDPKKFETMYDAARLHFATNDDYDNSNLTADQQTEILACYAQVSLLGVAFTADYQARLITFNTNHAEAFAAMVDRHDAETVAFHKEQKDISIVEFGVSHSFDPSYVVTE